MQEVKGFWTKKRRNTTTTKQKSKHKNPSQSLDLNPVSMPLLITSNNPMQRSMLNHLQYYMYLPSMVSHCTTLVSLHSWTWLQMARTRWTQTWCASRGAAAASHRRRSWPAVPGSSSSSLTRGDRLNVEQKVPCKKCPMLSLSKHLN